MLAVHAPFPEVGSYGLLCVDGATRLARIIARNPGDSAVVSLPELAGASGNRTVPLAQIRDGTPLSDAERAEMRHLAATPFATSKPSPAARKRDARLQALRHREIDARLLTELMRGVGLNITARAA